MSDILDQSDKPPEQGDSSNLTILVPRAQHEALMAAAKNILDELEDMPSCGCSKCKVRDALRAAGIDPSEDKT